MFDFDTPVQRLGTDSTKWHKYGDKDIIPMWVADMDFQSPPAVMEALHARVDHGVFGYGRVEDAAMETILAYLQRAFGWQVDPHWLIWLPGLVTGLNVACRSVGNRDDEVLTTIPVYPPFLTAPRHSGRRLATTSMVYADNRWEIDLDDMEKSIGDDTALFILCNPHNPTGRVFHHDELTRLARICSAHDVVICSDEIHCDLILDPNSRHIPIASLSAEVAQNTITLMAPSKTYNIPGLSCSFAIIPNHSLRRRFKHAMDGIVPHVNVLGLVAAKAAYQKGQAWLDAVKIYLRNNHDMVFDAIDTVNGLTMTPAEATYLAWIDSRDLNTTDPALFFEQAGVGLSNGNDFKGPGYVRLNFGCPRPLLSKALKRMADAVERSI